MKNSTKRWVLYTSTVLIAIAPFLYWLHQGSKPDPRKAKYPIQFRETLGKLEEAVKLLGAFYDENKRFPTENEFNIDKLEGTFGTYVRKAHPQSNLPISSYFYDPLSNSIFCYKRISDNQAEIYSVGFDGKDNSGGKYDPKTRTGDITLRLENGKVIPGQLRLENGSVKEPSQKHSGLYNGNSDISDKV